MYLSAFCGWRFHLLPILLLAAAALNAAPLPAQSAVDPLRVDSATVIAGEQYRAGSLEQRLLGSDYRDLWTAPVRVPVLDLSRFAGGIEVEERGGGLQTTSLRFRGADGREYTFRSVDKRPYLAQHPDLLNTRVGGVIQRQTSSLHPAAALVAAPLLEAAGVLHAEPRLVVMPDDPGLGEFREQFAGMLGLIEERPNEGEDDTPGFAGSAKIVGTDELLERLEESPEHRVQSRAYLVARLMDIFLGDWDRHADQWRWARFDSADVHFWHPIPRDRDYALVNFDGLLLGVVRTFSPNAIALGPNYDHLLGTIENATPLDRLLLSDLPRPVWDSVAVALQARLSDGTIAAAVRQMPPAYRERSAERIEHTLRARRDLLPEAAARFYDHLADVVDIYATDEDEVAEVQRLADGSAAVRIRAAGKNGTVAEPYFQRTFRPNETDEVRIYLRGGDDRATVRGEGASGPAVRVIGGGGDDVLADSSRTPRSGKTAFYDSRGEDRLLPGRGTVVDRRPYDPPPLPTAAVVKVRRQDRGERLLFTPWADWKQDAKLVIGGGPIFTRYGFRQDPYAYRLALRGMYAPWTGRVGLDFRGDFHRANSPLSTSVYLLASQLEVLRFYGFGNNTPSPLPSDRYIVRRQQLLTESFLNVALARDAGVSVGPVVKYTDSEPRPGSPLEVFNPLGSEPFGQIGGRVAVGLDSRDAAAFARRGLWLNAGGTVYPAVWDATEVFGEAHLDGAAYLPLPRKSTLALRAGGKRVWGEFPFHEAAFIGGAEVLRGFQRERFAGDAALYGGAELRALLARAKLLVVRGELGALALADAGRVYLHGDSPGGWHTGVGGGIWFAVLDRAAVVSAIYAHGERDQLYLRLGMPF